MKEAEKSSLLRIDVPLAKVCISIKIFMLIFEGSKLVPDRKVLEVRIEPGMSEGTRIPFR